MNLTPTEQKIYDVLCDGKPHRREELMALIDSETTANNVQSHVKSIRKKIKPYGLQILCDHLYQYHLIRILASANDGIR